MLAIYKPAQGKRTRWITFGVGCGLGVIMAHWLSDKLAGANPSWLQWMPGGSVLFQYGLPVLVAAAVAGWMFVMINRPKMADFLIATEGEMKKVSWSSRREIIGSTKVVIFTTFALAVMLFLVDFLFSWLFITLGVIQRQQG